MSKRKADPKVEVLSETSAHVRAADLSEIDFRVSDRRVVWATSARASSKYSSDYTPDAATGRPCVFPDAGDYAGTWLADSDDSAPWLRLELPAIDRAVALIVLETCGAGAVWRITNAESGEELYRGKPQILNRRREPYLLHVPLAEGSTPPRHVKLEVAPRSFGDEWHEIDAVGLLRESLAELRARPPVSQPIVHERHPASALAFDPREDDWRIRWARSARASSEWSSSYGAKCATGRPKVFPAAGDREKTWLARSGDAHAWLELEFAECERVYGFIALETCGAGSIVRATDGDRVLWEAPPDQVSEGEARLLWVPLEDPTPPHKLRLWVSPKIKAYRQIDAVALVLAPFEELSDPPPPPPPPPRKKVPGEPQGGFTMVEGTLHGVSAAQPFVYATLRTPTEARVQSAGGPLLLRTTSGEEVALETERTIVYGAPLTRARGTWAEASTRLPQLAALFASAAPAPQTEVELEGRCLQAPQRVYVAGTPSAGAAHGFRESARGVSALRVAALCTTPVETTRFMRAGPADFDAHAQPLTERVRVPSLIATWAKRVGLAAALCTAATAATCVARALGETSAHVGGTEVAISLGALFSFVGLALAAELAARTLPLPHFAAPGRGTDRRVAYGPPGWTVFGVGFFLVMASLIVGPFALMLSPPGAGGWAGLFVVPLSVAGLYASTRLVLWWWVELRTMLRGLAVLLTRAGLPSAGRAKVSGTLAGGQSYRHTVSYASKSVHTGVEYVENERGERVARDTYRHWNEREWSLQGPEFARVRTPDGRTVCSGRSASTTDMALSSAANAKQETYATFASSHEEGDPATLLGTVIAPSEPSGSASDAPPQSEDVVLHASVLVLGLESQLRWRIAVRVLAMLMLAALPIAGLLPWLLFLE